MSIAEYLERAKGLTWHDPDGEVIQVTFSPGLQESEIKEIEQELDAHLPLDFREALAHCCEIRGLPEDIDLSGRSMDFEMPDLLPHALPFAADGYGNFWVVDMLPKPEALAAIFFVCHDPPVLVFQCVGFVAFVEWLMACASEVPNPAIQDLAVELAMRLWEDDSSHKATVAEGDAEPDVAAFAATLEPGFTIFDLRKLEVGAGFAWGRSRGNPEVRRESSSRLFAYRRPPKKPGLLDRLFGKTPPE